MANRPARFYTSDLARAVKVVQQAGLRIARIEIDPSGRIVLHMLDSNSGHDAPDSALEAVRRKIAARRAERLAKEARP